MIKLLLFLLLVAAPAHAAEFTVDERSLLHLGLSTIISAGVNQALIAGNANKTGRVIFTFTNCVAIGAIKEFGIDLYPDYGDLAFDALGCALGISITEGFAIRAEKNKLNLDIRF